MSYKITYLIPCPFCGANVKKSARTRLSQVPHHKGYYSIVCSCGAFGPKEDGIEKAIRAWNKREYYNEDSLWNPFNFQKHTDLVDLKGNLKSVDFTSIMQILSWENRMGILQLAKGQKKGAICLKDGKLIAATSNYGAKLGQILVEKGIVSLARLQEVLDKTRKSGRHLGETLLDLDYISQDSLRNIIRHQITETIRSLILWEGGSFEYRDCPIEFEERVIENISITGMMLDALRYSDEIDDAQKVKTTSKQENICNLEASIGISGD